jgi:sRNA-binding carbon storage regulator CsrA
VRLFSDAVERQSSLLPMLVVARKRHETLTIDGNIRVEVLSLGREMARLRFATPRGIAIQRGVPRPGEPAAIEAANGGIDDSGMALVDLTLCGQQIVTVRDDIHLSLVDVDATRALLFIDAPDGVGVRVELTSRPRTSGHASGTGAGEPVQAFLPFTSAVETPSAENGHRGPRKNSTDTGPMKPAPRTIPFPWARPGAQPEE